MQRDSPGGVAFAAAAYVIWGIIPLYWRMLAAVPAYELTLHRIVWCAVLLMLVLAAQGRLGRILSIRNDRKLLLTLSLTGVLLAINWGVYIWAVESDQLVESSLGYYILPLLSIALGVFLLGETLAPLRRLAVLLGIVAVVVQTVALGRVPWIALTLAASFGLYGYLRKTANISALEGVFVESALLAPVALAYIVFRGIAGEGALFAINPGTDVLLLLTGPVTALPLVLFSAGARRIRLSTLGFLQYLAPSITLVLATFGFGEPFTIVHAVSFGCVWLALLLLAFEGVPQRLRSRRAVP